MTFDDVIRHRALVVGAGVAGLTTALDLGEAAVLTAAPVGAAGSTALAKGGVAAAIGADDAPAAHAADTMAVGAGLADPGLVATLTDGGPAAVAQLIGRGARFDRDAAGALHLGREAGHGRRRILHAGGDATGAEISRALAEAVHAAPGVAVFPGTLAVDLVVDGGEVAGLIARHPGGRMVLHLAGAVVLATGGAGRLWARTTNPGDVRGDGLAIAARAGARLADLEFVQFHPTALAADLDPMPLLSEALRGEGAFLVDDEGGRYMLGAHPDAELAPRDVVARATWRVLESGRKAYLDATHLGRATARRFPSAAAAASAAGLDLAADPLPVSPAAHYFMGGVAADGQGRSSLPGLWVVGEAAATGVHGANRLASNSLLEGMVFGGRVADSIRRAARPVPGRFRPAAPRVPNRVEAPVELEQRLRAAMWAGAGVVRSRRSLHACLAEIEALAALDGSLAGRNLRLAARLVASAALTRRESRGAHHRSDHPAPDPAMARRAFHGVSP